MMTIIQEEQLNVKYSCALFELSESSYYDWKKRKPSKSQMRRVALCKVIREIYETSHGIYGAPKITEALKKRGHHVGLKLVQKLMKTLKFRSVVVKKFRPAHSTSDNIVRENLVTTEPTGPRQVLSTDITYIWTKQDGWCYLSTIMDRYTKKILAWDLGKRMTEDLVIKTFNKVIAQQELPSEVILHSDQGSQYTSKAYEALLKAHQVKHSFSRKGYPYHNASLESWHGHLKREWIYQHDYQTFDEARKSIFWYIEAFYNQRRIHQTLGYLSPDEFEKQIA